MMICLLVVSILAVAMVSSIPNILMVCCSESNQSREYQLQTRYLSEVPM